MDNFVVSARKYRPTTFDSVVGQTHITTTLKNAIKSNHLAQSFLFCGPRGVGKTTNARILAKTINCEAITVDVEACDKCNSCLSFNANSSFNIHELDAASNNSVDDIRSLVDQVRYPPQGNSKYKIYIIDEVHMLSNAAFNAFLKTLEEPPKYAIFILATTEKHKIIPTILSRCQIFDFNRIQIKDIADHLARIADKEKVKAEPQALHLIAQKADGALRDALSIFDLIVTFSSNNTVTYKTTIDNLHILDYDYYFKITNALYDQDISTVLITYDEILKQGFDGHNFIVGLSEHFRNLMVCKDFITIKLLEVADEIKNKYHQQSSKISLSFLMSGLNIANQCDLNFKSSKNHRLHVELSLLKIGYLNATLDIANLKTPTIEEKKKPELVLDESYQKSQGEELGKNNVEEKNISQIENPVLTNDHIIPIETPIPLSVSTDAKITFNLKSLKNLKEKISAPAFKELNQEQKEPEVFLNKEITLDQVLKLWQDFARRHKKEGNSSEFIIMDRPIRLENNTIILQLDNLIQVDLLNNFKSELLEFLRKNLKCHTVSIEVSIAENPISKKIYTSKDKFHHMAEKFPLIKELKNKLGLETDF